MPLVDGLQFWTALRGLGLAAVPVIVYSGRPDVIQPASAAERRGDVSKAAVHSPIAYAVQHPDGIARGGSGRR